MSRVLTTAADMRAVARGPGQRAVVTTMGALHDGHVELMRQARAHVGPEGMVVATIFVNPTQFGAGEDFGRYPRTLDDDVRACSEAGVDVVFAPGVVDVYGNESGFAADTVTVDPGPRGRILEGASRPGHFTGVLTVVAKLFGLTTPGIAFFGEKDYQQLVLIRRMSRDLNLGVDVIGVPTVREADGLAMSSRNRYLTTHDRAMAAAIPEALRAAVEAAESGERAALDAGRDVLARTPAVDLDYLVVTDPELGPAPAVGEGRVLMAARVGSTRLIDNLPCRLGA